MTKYEDVANQTTEEYFNGNQFSIDAFKKKYTTYKDETYVQALKRVCDNIASVEKTEELRKYWSERWFDEIYNDWWHPAGSIMEGAGANRNVSLANCTTISLGTVSKENEDWDNLESIFRNTAYTVAKCAAYRQGLGVDFSRLRPKGSGVSNSARESTGAIHWMKFIDSIGYYVGQKGRIPAMLFSISCKHPDLIEFIEAKKDYTVIQNANISVQITDDFYEAVENDDDWYMEFVVPEIEQGNKVYIDAVSATPEHTKSKEGFYSVSKRKRFIDPIQKTMKARKILELIAQQMFINAEPGIQNIDLAKYLSNSDYVYDQNDEYDSRIISSNAPLIGNTRIPTRDGIIPIKELYERGESIVLTDSISTLPDSYIDYRMSKNLRLNYFPTITFPVPAKFKKYENQKVWKVVLSNKKELYCNSEHSWLINGSMKKTKDISIGDKIYSPTGGVVDAYSMESDKQCAAFKDGELVGYIVGDGWIGKESDIHNKMIGIVYDKDCEYFNRLFRQKYFELTGKELLGERDRGKIKEIRTENKKFVDWFISYGFAENKYYAPEICFRNFNFCCGFLKGLFQADGSVHVGDRQSYLNLTTVSKELALSVESLLSNYFGIFATINESKSKGVKYLDKISNAKNRFDLRIGRLPFLKKFNKYIGLIGDKGSKLERALNKNKRKNRNFNIVISVEETNRVEDMYCAVVDGIHSFIADGIMSSNCSEQYLSRESLCVLASQNAGKFSIIKEEFESQQERIASSINRFLDNVNEAELQYGTYATYHQKLAIQKLRRTGAGFTNLSAWLFKQNLPYGTKEAVEATGYFTEIFNYYLYRNSIELGKEKGSFCLFNREKLQRSPFIKHMMSLGLEFESLRNVTCSSIAPTGTLSLMFREEVMSYGAEPGFGIYYWKRTRISGKYEYYFCVPSVVREFFAQHGFPIPMDSDSLKDTWDGKHGKPIAAFIDENKDKIGLKFKTATQVSPFEKLDMMSAMMQNIDSSISITYLLPENTNWKDVYNFILEARKKGVKSIAAFPDRQMYGIVSFEPFKELAQRLIKQGIKIHNQNFVPEELKQLGEENIEQRNSIVETNAPKRPKVLPCDVYFPSINKEKYVVCVGLLNGKPYETFACKLSEVDISTSIEYGAIEKCKRGHYRLKDKEGNIIFNDVGKLMCENQQAVTRLISTALRHGAGIEFLLHQLEKIEGPIHSFVKAISRCLKKYAGNRVLGQQCPKCGSEELVRVDGCVQCSCSWSKC